MDQTLGFDDVSVVALRQLLLDPNVLVEFLLTRVGDSVHSLQAVIGLVRKTFAHSGSVLAKIRCTLYAGVVDVVGGV